MMYICSLLYIHPLDLYHDKGHCENQFYFQFAHLESCMVLQTSFEYIYVVFIAGNVTAKTD